MNKDIFDDIGYCYVYLVLDFNQIVKCLLEIEYCVVWVEVEILNLVQFCFGYIYLLLKDDGV